ncbi:uncharacterized protein A4U43_C05F1030 [Asparagus officinalis]|uniref:Uncharacterized protein n=1 Tax=Asparagus officinalis TaxID=4686 RepID=A0A5P1EPF2_ASPOF|nr:uncharacterized protein LOC109844063 [Asparagus officinalis]ONK67533.1 uncharacterized protein A4U43_C05F1030 [Asparagus officinalis]
METLVAVAQHQNQYCSRRKSWALNQFCSSPSRGPKGINCCTFEAGLGILQSPPSVVSSFNHNYHEPQSPCFYSEPPKPSRRSNLIAISPKPTSKGPSFNDGIEEFSDSELWAGPAYSNSPAPSSLPIPKFSLRQKRSVSLELPLPSLGIELPPVAKSAPPSPSRESFSSATENLRRILHLDIADD